MMMTLTTNKQYISVGRVGGRIGYLVLLSLLSTNLYASSLGAASPYNVFVFGDFTETGADTGGRLAVGGNASFANYYAVSQSVKDLLSAPNNDYLVVDGNILAGPVNLDAGNAYVGGTGGSFVQFPGGGHLTSGGPSPIGTSPNVGVAAQAGYYTSYSNQLSQLAANGTVNNNGFGTITLTGTDPNLDVFTIAFALLGGNNSININDPVGATVLINVVGTSGSTTGASIKVNNNGANGDSTTADAQKVLFNFYQATSLTFGGSVIGSVLAPNANVTGSNGQLDGALIAKNYTGTTEFHDLVFNGSLPSPVPEPGTWAMFLLGLGLLAASRKNSKVTRG